MNIKDLRAIKKKYIQEYEPNTLILNLTKWPYVELVITHSDKKGWATFYNRNHFDDFSQSFICFGRGNQVCSRDVILYSDCYSGREIKNIKILINNKEVQRVYTEYIKEGILKVYRYCYWDAEREMRRLLLVNPSLYTEVSDGIKDFVIKQKNMLASYLLNSDEIDPTQPTFKLACPQLSFKYAKFYFTTTLTISQLQRLRDLNYSPEEILKYKSSFCQYQYILHDFWSNRKLVQYYAKLNEMPDWRLAYNFIDYLRMYQALPREIAKQFPLTPKIDNLNKWHDRIIHVYNNNLEQIRKEQLKDKTEEYLKNHYPKAKVFEYSNDEYSIIACSGLEQLMTEGTELHHCVGSYTNSVSKGNEYILFLRRKEEINKPFYTIDLTPDKKVRQIHGLYNCNLTKELEPFINEWSKKFKLDVSNCSGIYCALN